MSSLYDFDDMTGVPEELANAVTKERTGRDPAFMEAVAKVAVNAPSALGLKQIMVVLHKMVAAGDLEKVPSEATCRNYANLAREAGMLGKPTRQTYWTVESDVADDEQEAEVEADAVEADEDPIAQI